MCEIFFGSFWKLTNTICVCRVFKIVPACRFRQIIFFSLFPYSRFVQHICALFLLRFFFFISVLIFRFGKHFRVILAYFRFTFISSQCCRCPSPFFSLSLSHSLPLSHSILEFGYRKYVNSLFDLLRYSINDTKYQTKERKKKWLANILQILNITENHFEIFEFSKWINGFYCLSRVKAKTIGFCMVCTLYYLNMFCSNVLQELE